MIHLSVHSKASALQGSADLDDILTKAKELNHNAVALTNYCNVFDSIDFYKRAQKEGIKPILGCEFFFCEDAKQFKLQKIRQVSHVTLIAENNVGWKNITRLISLSYTPEYFFYRPRIDFSLLEKYKEGVICLSGNSFDGVISYNLYDKIDEYGELREPAALIKAEALVRRFTKIFGSDRFYLEVQNHKLPVQIEINNRLRSLASKYELSTVATNNVHYVEKLDAQAHKTLLQMDKNQFNKTTYVDFTPEEYYLKSDWEMHSLEIEDHEIEITEKIASRCNVDIDLSVRRLPKYNFIPDGETSVSYLEKLAFDGLSKIARVDCAEESYEDRLSRELQDIEEMGFSDYFLIIHDVMSWVKSRNISIGYGRGSAGGSLVSYALGITDIDPLQYGLIWERFLNKGRGGLPDVDSDIQRSRRKEVLDYISERFGKNNVAQIVTLGGLQARAILKEVFRVYDVPFDEANKITSLVPAKNDDHSSISLKQAIEKVPELKEYYNKYKPWFEIAISLEGCYKSIGIHPAAVVISDIEFDNSWYPLTKTKDGNLIFGWDMKTVDSLNLLKLDILGLTTLDDIDVTYKLLKDRHDISIFRNDIPLDDPVTYSMLEQGFTVGVFQIEKQLGKNWCKQLKPKSISELSDLISLIRPATLDSGLAKQYADTKNGLMPFTPAHELLAEVTKDTQGVLCYQEESILACQKLAKMTLVESDQVRKCLPKGTKVLTYKNGYVPIEKLMSYKDKRLTTIDLDNYRTYYDKVSNVWHSGKKKVFKITTSSNYTICATEDHEFLINETWNPLKNIRIGDAIAVSHFSNTQGNSKITDDDIVLCALLTSEGYIPNKLNGSYFCNSDPELLDLFRKTFIKRFKRIPRERTDIKEDGYKNVTYIYLKKEEIKSLRHIINFGVSREKILNDNIINTSLCRIRKFLGIYLSCDGWVDKQGIHFCSASFQICSSIKRMLLRCGVYSTVYSKWNKQYERYYWNTSVTNAYEINKLIDQIRDFISLDKRSNIKWNSDKSYTIYMGIPSNIVIKELYRRMDYTGRSKRNLWTDSGSVLNTKMFSKQEFCSRQFFTEKLLDIQNGDLIWDTVKSIEYVGIKDVYDFTMDNNRPYAIVEDFLVHNCIGKKKQEELRKWKPKFIDGCTNNNVDILQAEEVWSQLEKFAGYQFNKCLSGRTIVNLSDGTVGTIKQLYNWKDFSILSYKDGNLVFDEVKEIIKSGIKTTYRLTLNSGDSIRCTLDHRIYTKDGWKCLRDIKVGDLVPYKFGFDIGYSEVISIDDPISEMTYDIEMYGDQHNFIANNFISHNSHGIGYALLSYQTAYLKANYPTEFFCAKLIHAESHPDKFEQMAALVYDAKLFDIEVVPPRLSQGNKNFSIIDDNHIAFGLSSLKGVGASSINKLSKDYGTFDNFLFKDSSKVSSAVVVALIRSGAFDDIEDNRIELQSKFDLFYSLTDKEKETIDFLLPHQTGRKDWVNIVRSLCDENKSLLIKEKYKIKIPNSRRRLRIKELINEYDQRELFDSKSQKIIWEQFYLGISLSGSEVDAYKSTHSCVDIIKNGYEDMNFNLAVCVDGAREIVTKKGDPMAFLTAHDNTYLLDNIVVFPKTFSRSKGMIKEGNLIRISGHLDNRGSLIANRIERVK